MPWVASLLYIRGARAWGGGWGGGFRDLIAVGDRQRRVAHFKASVS